ncbi:unnamed protein product [Linum trigynum]|uniref:Uncharacterized protein n=1 Tax=Linum trigynum TaxID=586398 RepID=A0AAV2D5J1_9ROSI
MLCTNTSAQVAPATVSIPPGRPPDDPASGIGPLPLPRETTMVNKSTGNEATSDMVVDETQTAAAQSEEALMTRVERVMSTDPSKLLTSTGVGILDSPDNSPHPTRTISYAGGANRGQKPSQTLRGTMGPCRGT